MKKGFIKEISVIVPTFNEQGNIQQLIKRIADSLKLHKYKFEIIVVDDNSEDKTVKIIKKLPRRYHLKLLMKQGKKGKAYSLLEGFSKSKYRNIAFIDADLQYPPEEIAKMAAKLKNDDIICANRKRYKDSIFRKVLSRTFRFGFGKVLFGLDHDIQAGLKLFKKEVLKAISLNPSSPWTFDLEFLHNAREAGFLISDHDITFNKRTKGNSKIGILKSSIEVAGSALSLRLTPVTPKQITPDAKLTMKGAGFRYKRKKYITHTTLNSNKSAIRTFTGFQKILITLVVATAGIGLVVNTIGTFTAIVAILSAIYFLDTVFNFYVIQKSLRRSPELKISKKLIEEVSDSILPIYTILCPLYKEAHIIPEFIENISRISWPKKKLDVILLLEQDDKESINATKKLKLPSFVRVVVVPNSQPKTKPKACNYGLAYAKGEYLVIYDAEDQPERDQLKKAYLAFQKVNKDILCLQAKLNYYNPSQNLLTRFFTAEYSLWFDVTLTGLQSINTSIPLGGTSNHFRVKDLIRLHGWDPFNVTEDADLGMRLFKDGYKTAIIDSITYEEANSKWGNWIRQRSRWIKGYMQTYLVHTRNSFSFAKNYGKHFPIFHMVIGGKIAFILINPFLWIATISYFSLYVYIGPAIERLYPAPVFYMAVFSLVFGNFLFMYYYMIGVMKRGQYSLVKYVFLIPLYWLMISVAGFMALYQLFFKPFYWEKTVHGLHIKEKAKARQVHVPQPVLPVPQPSFRWAYIAKIFTNPLVAVGDIERKALSAAASTLIFIGEIEKKSLQLTVRVFKKGVVHPIKYATSILS